jgi:hypothetical protein
MARRGVPVRVIRVREQRRWFGGLVMAAGLVGVLLMISDSVKVPMAWQVPTLVTAIVMWIVGPLLVGRARPFTAVTVEESETARVRIGKSDHTILTHGPDVSVAKGDRGYSIAVATEKDEPLFVEVDTEKDARAFLESIGVTGWPGNGSLEFATRNETRRLVQRVISVVALVCLFVSLFSTETMSRVFGVASFVGGIAAMALHLFDAYSQRRFILGDNAKADRLGPPTGKGKVEEHLRAHLHDRVPSAKEDDEEEQPASSSAAVHARVLDGAGDESTRAWLTRIDALRVEKEQGGYRGGGAPSADDLRAILDDATTSPKAKLAAARLLKTKYQENADELRTRVAAVDQALAPSIRVVLTEENADTAAEELDAIGPAFRAMRS